MFYQLFLIDFNLLDINQFYDNIFTNNKTASNTT